MSLQDRPNAVQLPASDGGYDIELRDVTFGYNTAQPILQNFSLRVPAGTSCAIVGTSGSGKSTVLRLLFRFMEPSGGQILVGGADIQDVTLSSLQGVIGQVPQVRFLPGYRV